MWGCLDDTDEQREIGKSGEGGLGSSRRFRWCKPHSQRRPGSGEAEQLEPGERGVGKARERWREQRKDKQNRTERRVSLGKGGNGKREKGEKESDMKKEKGKGERRNEEVEIGIGWVRRGQGPLPSIGRPSPWESPQRFSREGTVTTGLGNRKHFGELAQPGCWVAGFQRLSRDGSGTLGVRVSFSVSSFASWEGEQGLLWGSVESAVRYHTGGF